MSREQTVRDVAYAIWEAEGKPKGRDAEHWRLAEERVATSLAGGPAKAGMKAAEAKPPAKGKVASGTKAVAVAKPVAKPPAKPLGKPAATKTAPRKQS